MNSSIDYDSIVNTYLDSQNIELNESTDGYKKTLYKILRSNDIIEGNHTFIESKTFNNFFSTLEKRTYSSEENEKILEVIFTYINQLKRLNQPVKSSQFTALFDRNGIKFLYELSQGENSKQEIKELITYISENNIPFTFISSMMNRKGLPKKEELDKLFKEIQNIETEYDIQIPLKNISGILSSQGIPTEGKLTGLFKEITEIEKEHEIKIPLNFISSIMNGKGIPTEGKLTGLFREITEVEKEHKKEIPLESISGILAGKGIPEAGILTQKLQALFTEIEKLEQLYNIQIPFKFVSSIMNGKEFPEIGELTWLLEEVNKLQHSSEREIPFVFISSIMNGKGIPNTETGKSKLISELRGLFEEIQILEQQLNTDIPLSFISGILSGKGFYKTDIGNLTSLVKEIKILEKKYQRQIPFRFISSMMNKKGSPKKEKLEKLFKEIQDIETEYDTQIPLIFISGIMNGKGIPATGTLKICAEISKIISDSNLSERENASLLIFSYEYIEQETISIGNLQKEIMDVQDKVDDTGYSNFLHGKSHIKTLPDYYKYCEQQGFTRFQSYFMMKKNSKNIKGILQLTQK